MALTLIGAGFGRTGTRSPKIALEPLGLAPCCPMSEVFQHPEHVAVWSDALAAKPVDWDALFSGYVASVDWPGCHFWRELSRHYPDAKVLLTLRSAESWYASVHETIYQVLRNRPPPGDDLPARRAYELGLVNHVVPDGQALATAKEIAARIPREAEAGVQRALSAIPSSRSLRRRGCGGRARKSMQPQRRKERKERRELEKGYQRR